MRLINYTKCIKREHKLYSIAGIAVPNGFTVSQLVILLYPIASLLIGFIISRPFKINMLNLLDNLSFYYTVFWLSIGLILGCSLTYIKVQHYSLGEYLRAYLSKKKSITTEPNIKKHFFKRKRISVDTIVRSEV